jgi:hypothetical protein
VPALWLSSLAGLQPPPDSPIVVKIIEPPHNELSGLAGILIGSLGLTGAVTLLALVLGVLVGGLMFLVRSRRPLS